LRWSRTIRSEFKLAAASGYGTSYAGHDRVRSPSWVDRPQGTQACRTRGLSSHQFSAFGPSRPYAPRAGIWRPGLRSYRRVVSSSMRRPLKPELAALAPRGESASWALIPTQCGYLRREPGGCRPFTRNAVDVARCRGTRGGGDTRAPRARFCAMWPAEFAQRNFRIFGPDETVSIRPRRLFQAHDPAWEATTEENDSSLARTGRVMVVLSEPQCEVWLREYLP